jgi:hypothetical protein
MAAREIDKKNVAELLTKTIDTLMAADIACDSPDAVLKVSPGADLKIWLSLDMHARCGASEYEDLAVRIIAALSAAGLRLPHRWNRRAGTPLNDWHAESRCTWRRMLTGARSLKMRSKSAAHAVVITPTRRSEYASICCHTGRAACP